MYTAGQPSPSLEYRMLLGRSLVPLSNESDLPCLQVTIWCYTSDLPGMRVVYVAGTLVGPSFFWSAEQ